MEYTKRIKLNASGSNRMQWALSLKAKLQSVENGLAWDFTKPLVENEVEPMVAGDALIVVTKAKRIACDAIVNSIDESQMVLIFQHSEDPRRMYQILVTDEQAKSKPNINLLWKALRDARFNGSNRDDVE